jgi:hypothetical protein
MLSERSASAASRIDERWWAPLVEFAVHVVVGSAIFVVVAGAAVVIHWINNLVALDGWAASPLRILEYAIFVIDLVLFLIFILRTSARTAKAIMSDRPWR